MYSFIGLLLFLLFPIIFGLVLRFLVIVIPNWNIIKNIKFINIIDSIQYNNIDGLCNNCNTFTPLKINLENYKNNLLKYIYLQ
jgi:hypothetical protein